MRPLALAALAAFALAAGPAAAGCFPLKSKEFQCTGVAGKASGLLLVQPRGAEGQPTSVLVEGRAGNQKLSCLTTSPSMVQVLLAAFARGAGLAIVFDKTGKRCTSVYSNGVP